MTLDLFEPPPVDPLDKERLAKQLRNVYLLMKDGQWRTLRQIAKTVNGSEAGCSARLRELDNKYGRPHEKRRVSPGLWEYRLLL